MHEVHLLDLVLQHALVDLVVALLDDPEVLVVLGVLAGVMAEVETLALLDNSS